MNKYNVVYLHNDISLRHKKNEMAGPRKWMQPETIMLNELSQFETTLDPRFYINAENCVCLYDMKLESELSMGMTGTGGRWLRERGN